MSGLEPASGVFELSIWEIDGKNIKPVTVRNFQIKFIAELCSIESSICLLSVGRPTAL